jgi:hypothetical protein
LFAVTSINQEALGDQDSEAFFQKPAGVSSQKSSDDRRKSELQENDPFAVQPVAIPSQTPMTLPPMHGANHKL